MRIAVATDSNSGITPSEAKELGVYVVPMPFMIDEKEYLEDISLTQDEFYEKLAEGVDVVTSQPSPDTVIKFWEGLLKEYDEIVYIPMSSGLSSSCETAVMLAEEEFEGKVFVANNQRISVTQRQSVIDALKLVENGYSGSEIRDILEKDKFNSTIYIMVGTLSYLKKGGRITPAVYALGTLLKIKPILSIYGEKLDSFANARTIIHGKNTMINAIKNDMKNRLKSTDPKDYDLAIAYSHDREAALAFAEEVKKEFPDNDVFVAPLSLSVACHIGPSSLALAVTKKLDIKRK